ncbi:MAG TPA: hypothetical protein VN420_00030 [Candidatus Fimivivens sp.]|nr:hypothetical protein [Candidatus Fimivivens sp.]
MPAMPDSEYFLAVAIGAYPVETIRNKIEKYGLLTQEQLREKLKVDQAIRLVVNRFF